MTWTTRACTPADADVILALYALLDIEEFGKPDMDADDVAVLLRRDGETLLLLGDVPLGFAHVQRNGECDTVVDTSHDLADGARAALIDWVLERGRTLGVAVLEHWAGPGSRLNARALAPRGFRHTRTSWLLARELGALPAPGWPPKVTVEDLEWGQEPVWRLVRKAFDGLPFSHPWTLDEWRKLAPEHGPAVVGVRQGDALIACATRLDRAEDGYVSHLAVDPGSRGLGLGRALLHECFGRDRAAGRNRTLLNVDGENDLARRLYDSVGMTVVDEYWRWDLALTDTPE